jgi:acetylornithine deacetylase/succinyl-diaminopimelate desuccinylase-like protein
MTRLRLLPLLGLLFAGPALHAAPADIEAARSLLMEGVGYDTVKGRGRVPAYADWLRARLVAAGFPADDIQVDRVGDTAMLHLVWRGTGKLSPIAIAGHMDVVEADPRDWKRDPFRAVEEGGFLFGRGIQDNKFDLSMAVATLIALKQEGFRPVRDIHLFLSGDEETEGATAALQAKTAKAAGVAYLLNTDAGGGALDPDGKPLDYTISASEKSYADFQVTVTDPGGHSSRPTATNAIATLAAATRKIDAYRFEPQLNAITRASLLEGGKRTPGALGAAMTAFARNPRDEAAIAVLRADPGTIGQIGTTCVPTMVTGGHAPNALPQKAVLTVNCRIFPGVAIETVRAELERVVADPRVKVTSGQLWLSTPASPLRRDVMAAVKKAVAATHPGVPVVPRMEAGATDGVYYRALGIPAYGVGGLFMRESDSFAHGLDERVPVAAIAPALAHWRRLLTELAGAPALAGEDPAAESGE